MNNKKSPLLVATICFLFALYVTGAPVLAFAMDDAAPIWIGFLALVSILFVVLGVLAIREGLADKALRAAEQKLQEQAHSAGTRPPGLYTTPDPKSGIPRYEFESTRREPS